MFVFVESTNRSSLAGMLLLIVALASGVVIPPFQPPAWMPLDQILLRIMLPSLDLLPVSSPAPRGRSEMPTLFSSHMFWGPVSGFQLMLNGRVTLYTTLWSTIPW